jgi:ATP-dependent RNA helicase DDX27
MEAAKMQNMMEHEDEIKGRPARTWFQSERQKKEIKKKTAAAAAEGGEDDGNEEGGEVR